jgi:hypothetical protein
LVQKKGPGHRGEKLLYSVLIPQIELGARTKYEIRKSATAQMPAYRRANKATAGVVTWLALEDWNFFR